MIERRAGDRDRPMQLFRLRNVAARRVVRRGNAYRRLIGDGAYTMADLNRSASYYAQAIHLYRALVTVN